MKDDWKFITMESGERYAINTAISILKMQTLLVMNLDFSK